MTPSTKCLKCGAKAVRPTRRAGRTMRYRNIAALPIPADFPTANISQRRLETLIGVSQGYLSGIKSGNRQPSSAFVALLYLAAQPGATVGLERFFSFLGGPENLG